MRTKGVNFNHSTYSQTWMYVYNKDTKAFVSAYNPGGTIGAFTTSMDDRGNLTVTKNAGSGDLLVRLCGYGSGANLIVTINEEIPD